MNSKLKAFLFCTFSVAIVSLVVMMYYSVTLSKYTKIGVNYFTSVEWTSFAHLENFGGEKPTLLNTSQGIDSTSTTNVPSTKFEEMSTSQVSDDSRREKLIQKPATENTEKPKKGITTGISSQKANVGKLSLCPGGSKQVGPLYVDKTVPKMEDVEKLLSSAFSGTIFNGGWWKPSHCQARVKMALIIPFRDRYEQLAIFLRHIHPVLNRQLLYYRIFVIEQAGDTRFNRAMLFNIGFKEALKFDQYDCFIFHDVDLIPEDDRNEYSCPTSPRHMSVAVDKFQYILPYANIFGGAGALSREHFESINGFSNKFWGWGGEDDDLFKRIHSKGLKLTRPSMKLGRYTMIKAFHKSASPDEQRMEKLRDSAQRMNSDGLNSLVYTVQNISEHLLYTLVTVDVREAFNKNLR
ncbi:beta-1,4-galactosyltransferase 1-like [Montipora capricornis]|uniref:beta-1,4-galactosyltransferase 1-like n=1 Tax=Montipora capricornis TaxID=246305 RepID=UPI0035F180B9